MYILVKPDQTTVYPYSIKRLMRDNPNTSFRPDMTDSELSQWGMFPVTVLPNPSFNAEKHKVESSQPELINGSWVINKTLVPLTVDELSAIELEKQNVINIESREYLASTDWYVIRQIETGIDVPEDILSAREVARAAIVEVR